MSGEAAEELDIVEPTSREAAIETALVHRQAWQEHGVQDTWPRVIALVVQSGVVFDHTKVIDYAPARWMTCMAWSSAHSTDYQTPESALVRDGFRILKVGPGVTFALREALCCPLWRISKRSWSARVNDRTYAT